MRQSADPPALVPSPQIAPPTCIPNHKNKVEYEGFEKTVRTYLPKDEHIVFGIMGLYVGLYFVGKGISKLTSSPPKKLKAKPVVATADQGIPSVESPEFGEWIGKEGNVEKLLAQAEK